MHALHGRNVTHNTMPSNYIKKFKHVFLQMFKLVMIHVLQGVRPTFLLLVNLN